VITSGNFRNKTWENHPTDRSVTIRKSDMEAVKAQMDAGKPVTLEFNLDQKWRKGPIVLNNVVAEIKGVEKPDEVVIISGHIDSWDGPGSVGASDNGTGTITAMEAARLIMKSGAKPKRTIRFVLWSGEEQGIYGSRAYVAKHQGELDKISAVFVDDGGSNYIGGYNGGANMRNMMESAFAPVASAYSDLPMRFTERTNPRTQIGSDQDSFNAVGVPGFFTLETGTEKYGTQDYNFIHHTQHDTLKYVIPKYMEQSSVAHAVTGLSIANAETMLPRFPKFEYTINPSTIPGFIPSK
jgi:Zn-dependent M28 family amino/carboxypeptidase